MAGLALLVLATIAVVAVLTTGALDTDDSAPEGSPERDRSGWKRAVPGGAGWDGTGWNRAEPARGRKVPSLV